MDSRARSGSLQDDRLKCPPTSPGMARKRSRLHWSTPSRNCTCQFGLMRVRLNVCPPHQMLTDDQRALNGLLFARHNLSRLLLEEFEVTQEPAGER